MSTHIAEHKKKGQLEIIGISIVVILMIGAIVLAVKLNKPEQKSMRGVNLQQANSYLSSVLEVTPENCKKYSVKELIIDCKEKKSITCDDAKQSSEKYNDAMKTTADKTLGEWKKNYELKVGGQMVKESGCDKAHKNEDFAEVPIPAKSGVVNVSLKICY